MIDVLVEFLMNNPIDALIIGTISYGLVGILMSESSFYYGKRIGFILWLLTAIIISFLYNGVITIIDKMI